MYTTSGVFFQDNKVIRAGNYQILPWGDDNVYPTIINKVILEYGLIRQIINKKLELIWGSGPCLYTVDFTGGRRRKQWIRQTQIETWLEEWDYHEYLKSAAVDFFALNGHFTIYHKRAGNPRFIVDRLSHLSSEESRIEWSEDEGPSMGIIVGPFFINSGFNEFTRLPVFDIGNPKWVEKSASFDCLYQAMVEAYPRSPIHGSLSWIKAGTQIPGLLGAFNYNSIASKYHIKVPALYWEKVRERLIEKCQINGVVYHDRMLETEKDLTMEEVSNALSGISKAGKFLVTEIIRDELSQKYVGWEVIPIETRVREYMAGQLKIGHEAQFHVTAGMGMHPTLSGITKEGGLSPGSELQYAAKIYKNCSVDFAERVILKPINAVIAVNFPNLAVKFGFNRDDI